MFGILLISLTWLLVSFARAEAPAALVLFIQRAVPDGEIRYWGAFVAPQSSYHVFTLQEAERKGVLLVRQTSNTGFEVVGADTSFDSFPSETDEKDAVVAAADQLLKGEHSDPLGARKAASANDVCPLGASLNTLLIPIAGFTLTSNGTLGILRDLQHADAYTVDPERAPPGSILVCPSHFAAQGPVIIGSAVIVGPDRCVYGPDYRQDGAWHRVAPLREWLRANQSMSDIRGFLLRAKENDQDRGLRRKPSLRQHL